MKCLVNTHIHFVWVAQSYLFYQRNRSIVHGGERDTLSEAVVSLIRACIGQTTRQPSVAVQPLKITGHLHRRFACSLAEFTYCFPRHSEAERMIRTHLA